MFHSLHHFKFLSHSPVSRKLLSSVSRKLLLDLDIPFWVWRDYADELAPVVLHLQDSDYPGIIVTPVIARAFEKTVYKCLCKDTMESYLCDNQFAYREGGSCVDALLSIQGT
jgi:hypothetical protein